MRITRLGGRLTARALSAVLLTVALTATGLLVASPPKARAFAEDVCYTPGAPPHSCAPLPFACPPSDAHDPICGARAFFRYGYTLRQPLGGRSLVHTDSTYIMARKIGFSLQDAYWIAAYSEATDLGTFRPRDMRGNPVPNVAALTTRESAVSSAPTSRPAVSSSTSCRRCADPARPCRTACAPTSTTRGTR